jgi:hypothetical protein
LKKKIRPGAGVGQGQGTSLGTGENNLQVDLEQEKFIEIKRGLKHKSNLEDLKNIYLPNTQELNDRVGEKVLQFVPRPSKRFNDRHSGTGRGREISKNGGGTKTIWGNPKYIPKDETTLILEAAIDDIYNPKDENCKLSFNKIDFADALKKKILETELIIPEKGNPEIDEEIATQEAYLPDIPQYNHLDSKKEQKRKKKKGFVEVKTESSEILERPENGISYNEYLDLIKKKNENIDNYKNTINPNSISNLPIKQTDLHIQSNRRTSEDVEYQEFLNQQKFKKKKVKERKIDEEEEEINRMIGNKLSISNMETYQTKYKLQ